jgi:metallo-beta-lactamase family protein
MSVTLTFHGAARTVTGSCMELAAGGKRVLLDCGMFQGSRSLEQLNGQDFGFDPKSIDAVLLTHAHIDHCGLLPRLVKHGFNGPIYCTSPTAELLGYTLPDSGRIQEGDARRQNIRNARRDLPEVEPLYTEDDAITACGKAEIIAYGDWIDIGGIKARYWNAGHIIGSASVEVIVEGISILFSGDIGPDQKAFYEDPDAPRGLDYVISESTYGDRDKPNVTINDRRTLLETEIDEALERGGNLIIPSFAIERTQELLLDIAVLLNAGRIKNTSVFIDSPLATKATRVFEHHAHELEDVAGTNMFHHPAFHFVETQQQSMQLNNMRGCIILSASGMCDAGRVRHHLKHNLWKKESTVLFVGFQAQGSLGRTILDGAKRVFISGDEIAVRARIRKVDNYSAHADQAELVNWVKERLPISGALFLSHGEKSAMDALKKLAETAGVGTVIMPELGESYELAKASVPKRRTAAKAAARHVEKDWLNERSDVMAKVQEKLRRMDKDDDREKLLKQLRQVVESYERA